MVNKIKKSGVGISTVHPVQTSHNGRPVPPASPIIRRNLYITCRKLIKSTCQLPITVIHLHLSRSSEC
jgi:hypothetical protein